jgi:hypothetical protein
MRRIFLKYNYWHLHMVKARTSLKSVSFSLDQGESYPENHMALSLRHPEKIVFIWIAPV